MMNRRLGAIAAISTLSTFTAGVAQAETYRVGPDEAFATIQDTLDLLQPGDVVEVMGGATYPGDLWFRPEHSGVTVRGIAVDGARPVIEGVGTEMWHDMIVLLNANDFVFEGFEIVGDGDPEHQGLVHKADGVTLRDLVVHDVGSHGLLGTDSESGSLTLERSEFYANGNGLYDHQIYMATDESMYKGSVFRLQHCYVHDGAGGNNVKSRAERNEIYFNWIEGAVYHELDLIGPDGQDEDLAQENSDVVGNVLIKQSEWRIARIGGDGTGNTAGRYRFVNNTMILGEASETAIGLQETVESLELHNNVVIRVGPAGAQLVNHSEPSGPEPMFVGSHNWIAEGIGDIPASFTDTIVGADPGFVDLAAFDLRPQEGAPIVDAGTDMTIVAGAAVPDALAAPTHVPPARALAEPGERPADGALDIGAYELNTGMPPGPGDETGGDDSGTPTTGDDGGNESDAPTSGEEAGSADDGADETASAGGGTSSAGEADSGDADGTSDTGPAAEGDGGCGCRSGSGTPLALVVLGLALRRRRPR